MRQKRQKGSFLLAFFTGNRPPPDAVAHDRSDVMTHQDGTRKDRKERKQADDLTALQPAVVLPVLIDAPPANTPASSPDPAPSWDSGFGVGDSGCGEAGGDF
jgi:hypothetical protein